MKAIDLHVHSNRSDGSYTPSELVDYALQKGLTAIALTDHDTIDGLAEALSYAQDKPIEVIPGIEFSTKYEDRDIHVVGLYIRYDAPAFQAQLQAFVDSRINRNIKMCANLQGAGIDITYEKLCAENPDAVITRAHYASYLTDHGYVANRAEAFDKYLGDHSKYFVPREKVTPSQAVELILKAGGVPILAHPPLYHMEHEHLDALVARLKQDGLMGIETLYCSYSGKEERDMFRLAQKYDLLPSGGSDFHGANKPGLDLGCGYGKLFVPEDILPPIREAAGSNH
ncbi:MAG: PHP domain-containing protein [Roseburia sp.]|nr:PHP domain-containing protein [Ruminococcus sp.]MCM1155581.1 PHP domain-containing protein [Roseburia sp.]MCM1242394.1 PHP domain-containing protein [Roseburia sp.]